MRVWPEKHHAPRVHIRCTLYGIRHFEHPGTTTGTYELPEGTGVRNPAATLFPSDQHRRISKAILHIANTSLYTIKQNLQSGKQLQQFLFSLPEFLSLRSPVGNALQGKGLIIDQTTGFKCLYKGWNNVTIKKITDKKGPDTY
jgi:hypothetical protein